MTRTLPVLRHLYHRGVSTPLVSGNKRGLGRAEDVLSAFFGSHTAREPKRPRRIQKNRGTIAPSDEQGLLYGWGPERDPAMAWERPLKGRRKMCARAAQRQGTKAIWERNGLS